MGGAPKHLAWDVSRSHDLRDVAWPRGEVGEHSYEPVASFRIRLPEGREFVAKTKLTRVIVEAFEAHLDKVQFIGVNSQDMTTEEA